VTGPQKLMALLLAAGAARRFGGDKLMAALDGRSVIEHSAAALAAAGCRWKVAIISADASRRRDALEAAGYEVFENPDAGAGVSSSIKTGIRHAQARGADGVLIALADMPYVTAAHHMALIDRARTHEDGLSFSVTDQLRSPPGVFLRSWFAQLLALEGDRGAGAILRAADPACGVSAEAQILRDIDTPEDL